MAPSVWTVRGALERAGAADPAPGVAAAAKSATARPAGTVGISFRQLYRSVLVHQRANESAVGRTGRALGPLSRGTSYLCVRHYLRRNRPRCGMAYPSRRSPIDYQRAL